MKPTLAVLAAVAVLYGLHRLALWAEGRGWVYYSRRRGSSLPTEVGRPFGGGGALGNAFLEVQAIVEPSRRHLLEERVRERSEAQDSGDPPDAGA